MKGVIFIKKYKSYYEIKLEAEKRRELLKDYPVQNYMEEMAVKIISTEAYNAALVPGIEDIVGDDVYELMDTITKIEKDIGLK